MRPFEYARPQNESEALDLLNDHDANTAVLAGGTDLIALLQEDLQAPQRVVDIKQVESMQGIAADGDGVVIGALTTLEEISESPMLADYRSLGDVVDGVRAIQIQQMGTLGGDLCHLPNCWFYRNGYGLLALENGESLVAAGDNRYHAILGNQGPAKFVSAARFAPALIAWGADVRVIGPDAGSSEWLPLEHFFVTPKVESQGVSVLKPGQLISHEGVKRTVGVQRVDHPVPVPPGVAVGNVFVEPVRIGVAGDVEPVSAPASTVVGATQ